MEPRPGAGDAARVRTSLRIRHDEQSLAAISGTASSAYTGTRTGHVPSVICLGNKDTQAQRYAVLQATGISDWQRAFGLGRQPCPSADIHPEVVTGSLLSERSTPRSPPRAAHGRRLGRRAPSPGRTRLHPLLLPYEQPVRGT